MSRGDIPPRSRPTDVTGFIPPTAEAVCATCRKGEGGQVHDVDCWRLPGCLADGYHEHHAFAVAEADAVAAAREKMAAALVEYGQALSAAGLDEDIDRAVASQIENPRARVAELEAALREIKERAQWTAPTHSEVASTLNAVAILAQDALAPSAEEGGE